MSDFPLWDEVSRSHITTYSGYFGGIGHLAASGLSAPSSAAWPTTNLAIYIPFTLPFNYIVRRLFWANGTATGGNSSIGIYHWNGTGLYASGSTARSGNTTLQYVTPSSEIKLEAGTKYVLGLSHSATTANQVYGMSLAAAASRMLGHYSEASAVPLPADATFASFTGTHIPIAGITRTASGF